MPKFDLKYSYYVFGLILLSTIPLLKISVSFICLFLIIRGTIEQKIYSLLMGEFSKGNEYWFDWLFQWSRNFFENIHYHLGGLL